MKDPQLVDNQDLAIKMALKMLKPWLNTPTRPRHSPLVEQDYQPIQELNQESDTDNNSI